MNHSENTISVEFLLDSIIEGKEVVEKELQNLEERKDGLPPIRYSQSYHYFKGKMHIIDAIIKSLNELLGTKP